MEAQQNKHTTKGFLLGLCIFIATEYANSLIFRSHENKNITKHIQIALGLFSLALSIIHEAKANRPAQTHQARQLAQNNCMFFTGMSFAQASLYFAQNLAPK